MRPPTPSWTLAPGSIHVILVNYRTTSHVERHLSSGVFAGQDVVVVDNASDPDAIRAMCERYRARPVLLEHNTGFAGGVNAGLRHIDDDALPVLLLNPDVEVTAEALTIMLEALRRHEADAVAPLLINPDGRVQAGVAGGRLRVRSVIGYFLFLSLLAPRWQGIVLTRRQARREQRVAWLCMACALHRRDSFTKYGALPEDELVYAEDVAWGTTATELGAELWLVPTAQVRHESGASGGSAAWSGALERLLRRRRGAARGAVGCAVIRIGLTARRVVHAVITRSESR